jgi:hypothetical protein
MGLVMWELSAPNNNVTLAFLILGSGMSFKWGQVLVTFSSAKPDKSTGRDGTDHNLDIFITGPPIYGFTFK